jgi:hypothetical protein
MRIVSPFKPLPPERLSHHHQPEILKGFDWIEALRMLAATAKPFGYNVTAITDRFLPVPHIKLRTSHQDLMKWILEVSVAYLESRHFTEDTVFVSPDMLVNGPFPEFGGFDLGLCIRHSEKYKDKPLLNAVQMWPVASKGKLVAFFRKALSIAESMPEEWGMDTLPITKMISPIEPGIVEREGLMVNMIPQRVLLKTILTADAQAVRAGRKPPKPDCSLIDFKAARKVHMKDYYRVVYENR